MAKQHPPRFAKQLLLLLLKEELEEEVLGDLDEKFYQTVEKSSRRAKANYWYQIFNYIRPFALKRSTKSKYLLMNIGMLLNYWKAAKRFFRKNWALTTINVVVFGIALAACILILKKVSYEFSYDQFYDNHEHIYRVGMDHYYPHNTYQNSTAVSFYPIGNALVDKYPEIEKFTRVSQKRNNTTIRVGNQSFQENNFHIVNPSFFEVFSVKILYGDTIDIGAYDIFLSESLARKLFGKADAVGSSIDIWNGSVFKVKGVFKDVPANSHLHYDMLLTVLHNEDRMDNWQNYGVHTYIRVSQGVKEADMERKLRDFNNEFSELSDQQSEVEYRWEIDLQPIADIHLTSDMELEHEVNGDLESMYMLIVMAVLILIISCFNYINLTASMHGKRLTEFFVRKVHGANAIEMLKQYAFESFLLLLFGIGFAIAALLLMPQLSDYSVSFLNQNSLFYKGVAGALIAVILLSVVLPSSAFAFVNPLKFTVGEFIANPIIKRLGKSLIIVQFVVSFLLLAGALTVTKQLSFVTNKNPGVTISDVVSVDIPDFYPEKRKNLQRFKSEVEGLAGVAKVSYTESVPGTVHSWDSSIKLKGEAIENAILNYLISASADYFATYEIEILAGRVFDELNQADSAAILINETTAKKMGVTNYRKLIGRKVVMAMGTEYPTFEIVGIAKDYYHETLKNRIKPIAFIPNRFFGNGSNASIRLAAINQKETVAEIEKIFKTIFPHAFNLQYVEDNYTGFFNSYFEVADLIKALAILAMLMAGVGLLGLASNETVKRRKEVAIRKVNGAQAGDIYLLFLRYFGKLVGIAFLLSIPVSFYFADEWLSNFAERIDLGLWFFSVHFSIISIIGLIAISYFLVKISRQNPVVALKNGD
ncbi:MAG: ABC transporter permease [Bacteroidota bacterium]